MIRRTSVLVLDLVLSINVGARDGFAFAYKVDGNVSLEIQPGRRHPTERKLEQLTLAHVLNACARLVGLLRLPATQVHAATHGISDSV